MEMNYFIMRWYIGNVQKSFGAEYVNHVLNASMQAAVLVGRQEKACHFKSICVKEV